MKLRKLHIEDYKMFKNFDISFADENDEALPIVVLAGVNGSGKTTLLECLSLKYTGEQEVSMHDLAKDNEIELSLSNNEEEIIYLEKNLSDDELREFYHKKYGDEERLEFQGAIFPKEKYHSSIIYFEAGIDDTRKVADEFVKTFYFYLKEKDYRPSEITEYFNQYMKDIFNDLDIGFKYSHLDKEDKVWFTSNDGDGYYYTDKDNEEKVLFTIDELSTGQKTLLSKILYVYFKDYKDKVILIDEPELSLHPKWQNQILSVYEKLAEENNCQIIIATHSPHIIGSAKNKYLRILRKNEEGSIEVFKDLKAEGRDINSILFDVMGEVAYRPNEFDEKIDKLHIAIDDKKIEEAKKRLEELKKSYGENDEVVMEAQMLIDMFSRDE